MQSLACLVGGIDISRVGRIGLWRSASQGDSMRTLLLCHSLNGALWLVLTSNEYHDLVGWIDEDGVNLGDEVQPDWFEGFEGDKEALQEMIQGLVDPYLDGVLLCQQ